MYFQSSKKFARHNFSLIELLIVIGIMGALAALILPAFNDVESDAKDTACDYNQAGTLRYLQMFRSANGVYPTGFHTGCEDKGATKTLRAVAEDGTAIEKDSALTTCGEYNFDKGSTTTPLTANLISSLESAGIVSLAYGRGIPERISENGWAIKTVNAGETNYWTEELDAMTGEVNPTGAKLMYHNAALSDIATVGQDATAEAFDPKATYNTPSLKAAMACRKYVVEGEQGNIKWDEPKFYIAPFYVAPTVDWQHYYSDGSNDSKISIALAGKCPWGEGGQARYYIAFFKVYDDADTPATLLCTSCPDCGILEGDMF